jgi:hypothetical protein
MKWHYSNYISGYEGCTVINNFNAKCLCSIGFELLITVPEHFRLTKCIRYNQEKIFLHMEIVRQLLLVVSGKHPEPVKICQK